MRIGTHDTHPLADVLPRMPDLALRGLAEDIKANGQRESIWIFDGKVLDGRERYAACLLAGVEPRFRSFDGDYSDAVVFFATVNLHRKHLDDSVRAIAAAKLATLQQGQRQTGKSAGLTQAAAAAVAGVSERLVRDGRVVLQDGGPEVVAAVERGELAVTAAATDIREGRKPKAPTPPKDPVSILMRATTRALEQLGASIERLEVGEVRVAFSGRIFKIAIADDDARLEAA